MHLQMRSQVLTGIESPSGTGLIRTCGRVDSAIMFQEGCPGGEEDAFVCCRGGVAGWVCAAIAFLCRYMSDSRKEEKKEGRITVVDFNVSSKFLRSGK
jgi:hypothetical protein